MIIACFHFYTLIFDMLARKYAHLITRKVLHSTSKCFGFTFSSPLLASG